MFWYVLNLLFWNALESLGEDSSSSYSCAIKTWGCAWVTLDLLEVRSYGTATQRLLGVLFAMLECSKESHAISWWNSGRQSSTRGGLLGVLLWKASYLFDPNGYGSKNGAPKHTRFGRRKNQQKLRSCRQNTFEPTQMGAARSPRPRIGRQTFCLQAGYSPRFHLAVLSKIPGTQKPPVWESPKMRTQKLRKFRWAFLFDPWPFLSLIVL